MATMRNASWVCVVFSLLTACEPIHQLSADDPKHRVHLPITSHDAWLSNRIITDLGRLTIKTKLNNPHEEVTYGWYQLSSLDDFVSMNQDSFKLQATETGCHHTLTPISRHTESLIYEEITAPCHHKTQTLHTYGKAFMSDDGIYTVSYTQPESEPVTPLIQAINNSTLEKNTITLAATQDTLADG